MRQNPFGIVKRWFGSVWYHRKILALKSVPIYTFSAPEPVICRDTISVYMYDVFVNTKFDEKEQDKSSKSSNSHPSATANIAIHCLKRECTFEFCTISERC